MLDQDKDGETASTCGSASDLENDKGQQVSVPGRTLENDGLMEQASVPGCTLFFELAAAFSEIIFFYL